MIYPNRLTPNLIWLALILLFSMIIVYPSVAGISHVALLCGWSVLITIVGIECVMLGECMTADIGTDQAKHTEAIRYLRMVNGKLAAMGKFRRIRGDVRLYALVLLIAFTGNVFLALMFIVARLLRVLGEFSAARAIEEHDAKATTTNVGDTANDS